MLRSPRARLVALLFLLGALFGLLVLHGSLEPDPSAWALPEGEQLADDYGRYLGERVSVSGRVAGTDPVVIAAGSGADGTIRLRVVGLDGSVRVAEGVELRVYGIAEADRTIRALNAFAVARSGMWYAWSVSFLAGLWVLARIVRYWRIDWGERALRRRARPLRVRPWLRSRLAAGVDGDA